MFPKDDLKMSKENFQMLQPVLVCSRAFGLCPVSFRKCGHYVTIECSYGYAAFSFILPTMLAAVTVYSMMLDNMNQIDLSTDDFKRHVLTGCDVATIVIIVVFGVVSVPKKMKGIWEICKNFNEIEECIIIKDPLRYRITSIVSITLVMSTYCIVYALDIIAWHMDFEEILGFVILLRDYIPYYILKFIMLNQILLFCHMIYFTKLRLSVLSRSVQDITTENIFELTNFRNGEITVLPPNLINNTQINVTARRIQQLSRAHRILYETVETINKTGGFGIVIIMFSLLVHLIVTPFFLCSEIASQKNDNGIFIAIQVMWVIAHASKFFILLETCNRCVIEAENLVITVQRLYVQESVLETKKALMNFMMHLVNCKIEVNILGLFKLDRSILTGFVAMTTTYLVILLQLK